MIYNKLFTTVMKNKIINIFILILLATNAFGQTWFITRGLSTDEVAWGVDVDKAGNIYWAVEEKDQWPYWYYNILLFKIDSNARQIWQSNSWGREFNDITFKVTVKDSNIYLSGRTDSTGNPISGDALVICHDTSNVGFNWQYSYNPTQDYGYEEIDGLVVQPDGIYLSGWTQGKNANDMNFLIQKISLSGQLVWTNTWDYNNLGKFDGANGHFEMDDNFLYIAGHVNRTNIASLDGDGTLACFSRSNGDYQWNVNWGGSLYDDALGMTMSSDSMLYITGYTGSFGNGSQTYLNKYTRTGQLKWSRIWGGKGTEDARSLATDGDSIIYVVGTTSSYGNGQKDIFILKFDSTGTLIDSLFWGGAYDEIAKDVASFGDYLYITGETNSFGNGRINGDHKSDALLLKVNGRAMKAPDTTMTNIYLPILNEQNSINIYPNPFSESVTIEYSIPNATHVKLIIYDIYGKEAAVLLDGFQDKATDSLYLQNIGCLFQSGIYFCKLQAGSETKVIKMIKID